jgi:hypothetical protein
MSRIPRVFARRLLGYVLAHASFEAFLFTYARHASASSRARPAVAPSLDAADPPVVERQVERHEEEFDGLEDFEAFEDFEDFEDFWNIDPPEQALAFAADAMLAPFGARLVDAVESARAQRCAPRRRRSDEREAPPHRARSLRRHRGDVSSRGQVQRRPS